jgi:hypothetical protein
MKGYNVFWGIDVSANSPKEAAQKALEIMQDKNSTATVFQVTQHDSSETETIDLME